MLTGGVIVFGECVASFSLSNVVVDAAAGTGDVDDVISLDEADWPSGLQRTCQKQRNYLIKL